MPVLAGRKSHLLEQNVSELHGGIDVEFLPGQSVDLFHERVDAHLQIFSELLQGIFVHIDAVLLHFRQDFAERKFYIIIYFL